MTEAASGRCILGRLPLSLVAGEPETDPDVAPGHVVPQYLRDYKRSLAHRA
ncbi:MAG: hypothetical protein IIC86_06780 [Chloroflexi bacterium]|nr:hypothetical protein [Chloroflexota bacterium]